MIRTVLVRSGFRGGILSGVFCFWSDPGRVCLVRVFLVACRGVRGLPDFPLCQAHGVGLMDFHSQSTNLQGDCQCLPGT